MVLLNDVEREPDIDDVRSALCETLLLVVRLCEVDREFIDSEPSFEIEALFET